jgi:hypothetical protein
MEHWFIGWLVGWFGLVWVGGWLGREGRKEGRENKVVRKPTAVILFSTHIPHVLLRACSRTLG